MILRHAICIPTFDNPLSIEKTIADCLFLVDFPILVVDDGSKIPVIDILKDKLVLQALQTQRLRILRSETNQGKGSALQRGFKNLVALGFTHMIAVDGDGQHLPTEIEKLVQASLKNPWDLIIGNRKLTGETVPEISRFGRKFSNFWVKFQTDQKVADSQCGFRIYPLFLVQNMKFWTRGFDFEIEVLIRLLWQGVLIHEVDVDVFYPKPEERVSHFHKFWDNAKISILNTFLVVVSLLKTHKSPFQGALAVGIGVFVGCTPFYGVQTLILGAISFFFRLNALFLIVGSQISIAPVAPVIVMSELAIGKHLAVGRALGFLLGSFILGAALGTIIGSLTYFIMVQNQKQKKEPRGWNGKTRGGRFGNFFLKSVTKYLGLEAAYFCLYFIVPYFYLFAPTARKSAAEYWKIVEPQSSFLRRQRLILSQLFIFAQILLDRVYQSFSEESRFVTHPHGMENILAALKEKRGLIIMTAHAGGWDIAASLRKVDGFSGEFQMVRFENSGLTFSQFKEKADTKELKELLTNGEAQPIFHIKEFLNAGKPIGLMGDRPLGNHFELVLFFGKLAPIDTTAFRIAAACQAPVLVSLAFKSHGRSYDFFASRPKLYAYDKTLPKQIQIQNWAQEFATLLESYIRKYPTQWANFFPFWSTPPTATSLGHLEREWSKQAVLRPEWESDSKPTVESRPRELNS